jgi:hypothetical protein
MMRRLVVAAAVLPLVVAGCSNGGGSQVTADCQTQIRVDDGMVFTAYGFTGQDAVEHGVAEQADCRDSGPNAEGSVFDGSSPEVATWTFADYPPDVALGVRERQSRTFGVYIVDSVSAVERGRILQDLTAPR